MMREVQLMVLIILFKKYILVTTVMNKAVHEHTIKKLQIHRNQKRTYVTLGFCWIFK